MSTVATTRYRLPDNMGAHWVAVIHKGPDYWDVVVDLGDESFPAQLPGSVLVVPPEPPEPPMHSVVLVDNPADTTTSGYTQGSVMRRYLGGWSAPAGAGTLWTWAELCATGTPVLLVPAPGPIALPWTCPDVEDEGDGLTIQVCGPVRGFAANVIVRVSTEMGEALGIALGADQLRELARAATAAADVLDGAS